MGKYKNKNQVKFWAWMVKKWGNIRTFQAKFFMANFYACPE